MKSFSIYIVLSMLTGNPILALIIMFIAYGLLDRLYFGFLPDFFAPLKRNSKIRALENQLALNPANASAALELGTLYFEKKKYEKAIEYLQKASDKIENSARLHFFMGASYMEQGQAENAKTALRKALDMDARVAFGLPYIYLLRLELRDKIISEEELKGLEDKFHSFANTENFYRMGRIYEKAGDRKKSKEMYQLALRDYSYCPGNVKRLHRKWAFLSRIRKLF